MASVCGLSRARSWWGDARERTRPKSCEWLKNEVSKGQTTKGTTGEREKEAAVAAVAVAAAVVVVVQGLWMNLCGATACR